MDLETLPFKPMISHLRSLVEGYTTSLQALLSQIAPGSKLKKDILLLTIDQLLAPPKKATPADKRLYSRTINALLSGRKKRSKKLCGPVEIHLVYQLLMWTDREILSINACGKDCLELLDKVLASQKLHIGMFAHLRVIPLFIATTE